ncbi:MAG TPA: FKBP-type peptidyl-prolyl cis-trans isomerase [Mycobacteriales bacterium]|nr:FKBP-type peptidyl-prolyl cis-trans isomerase [Mycobacteriales bacterium]
MRRTPRVLAVAALAAVTLAACGSSKASTRSTADQGGSSPSATAPTTSASSGETTVTSHNVPDVTANATDLSKQPVLTAGKGDPDTTLATKDLVVGKGEEAVITDTVTVKYVGAIWKTGKVFDASWGKDNGFGPDKYQFPLNGVVPGFAQGIVGMKVGGRRVIAIPPALGYGPQGGQPGAGIGADDTIVFVVDLVSIP